MKIKLFTLPVLYLLLISCEKGEAIQEAETFNGIKESKLINNSSNPPLWIREYGQDQGWVVSERGRDTSILLSDGEGNLTPFKVEDGELLGHPREVADVNGDGKADVIGFANEGVRVSLSTGSKFNPQKLWIREYAQYAGGWRIDRHVRKVADVNGDGKADVIGFANEGVRVSLSTGNSFGSPRLWIREYAQEYGGWRVDRNPREVADVNGDGKADIVGFAEEGVRVSLSTGSSFSAPKLWIRDFAIRAGGWTTGNHPRVLADVNGDGKADIVGFANEGVRVSLSTGNSFGTPKLWIREYAQNAGGWRVNRNPRMVADVNGDGKADIVGFAEEGVRVSLSTGNSFGNQILWIRHYSPRAGGWTTGQHPRVVNDVNGDGKADIVGFSNAGAKVTTSTF
ncbi:FG-GAP repeat domain-containing protein [Aquimarina agarilytica]|uniref:FG-GAP repeat domain-containing protein n=1 Tax=Aquimarina agarilytica TaxID=1087449 RepID=UPI0012FB1776|nr:VCBS repeat-containing protein [Aquimarina agarilytica]